jgi:hypothetical protein
MVDHLASVWLCSLSVLQAKPRSPLDRYAPWVAPLNGSGGSLYLGLVLLLGTCIGRRELLPTLLMDAHWTSRLQEKRQQKRPT